MVAAWGAPSLQGRLRLLPAPENTGNERPCLTNKEIRTHFTRQAHYFHCMKAKNLFIYKHLSSECSHYEQKYRKYQWSSFRFKYIVKDFFQYSMTSHLDMKDNSYLFIYCYYLIKFEINLPTYATHPPQPKHRHTSNTPPIATEFTK